jgi:23S rRNA G2445 N2-methylase RlmL
MDVDAKRVEEARANAEGAGVGELVRFEVADAREFAPRPGWNAWVVSNLPYGKRIEADVRDLYQAFGRQLADCDGYHAALLCLAEPAAAQALGIDEAAPSTGVFPVINGGLECQILTTRIGS